MRLPGPTPTLRRFSLVLASFQLAVFLLAPLHELTGSAALGVPRVEQAQTPAGAPHHDPDTCPVCQLLTSQILHPDETRLAPSTETVQRPASVATAMPVARAPPAAHQPRAPPVPLA